MQKYKVIIIALGVFLVFIVSGYFLIQRNQYKEISISINAVPINSSSIVEIQNISVFLNSIEKDTIFSKKLLEVSAFQNLNKSILFVDSLIENNKKAKKIIENKSMLISFHLLGKEKVEQLCILNFSGNSEKRKIEEFIQDLLSDTVSINQREFDDEIIFNFKLPASEDIFYYCFVDNNFIFSKSDILVEKSILQIQSHSPLTLETSFKKVSELKTTNSSVKIYVNFEELEKIITPFASKDFAKKFKEFENFADWASLDLFLSQNFITISGVTNTKFVPEKYLAIFNSQIPEKYETIELLPEFTSEFILFGFSDSKLLYENYIKYLSAENYLEKHNEFFDEIRKKYEIFLDEKLLDIIDNEILIASINFNYLKNDNSKYIICKVDNNAESEIEDVIEIIAAIDSAEYSAYQKVVELNNEKTLKIYKFPFDNIFDKLFGKLYNFDNHKYFCFIDNNMVFSQTGDNILKFANSYYSDILLTENENFNSFAKLFSNSTNIFYFNNSNLNNDDFKDLFSKKYAKIYKNNSDVFGMINLIGLQFNYSEDVFLTNLSLYLKDPAIKQAVIDWGLHIDTSISIKPKIAINHYTNQKEIFVQDKKNNIYLINNSGEILWKKVLDEQIISQVYQVDYYKNNKLQLLFNTKNKIHLIDRNGENVENYPITLNSPASTGISEFDYDNKKNYRIFVPCENNKVYLYNIDGTLNDGWLFNSTENEVKTPVQYFSNNNKDYLVFADKLNTYILNRKGEIRIKPTYNFPKSKNNEFFFFKNNENSNECFVTTNSSGAIQTIYLDGSIKETKIKEFTFNHYFQCIDLNSDNKPDYIFLDNNTLEIYDNSGEIISSYIFKNEINLPISIYEFSSDNIKIGITDVIAEKIYLFNSDGNIYANFPLNGNYLFSIGILKGEKFSLITSYKENTLYNYQIE